MCIRDSSDIKPSFLSDDYSNESTANITLTDMLSGQFEKFENQSVSSSNPGYILIGNEIISYTGVVGSELTGITRGIDQTKSFGILLEPLYLNMNFQESL